MSDPGIQPVAKTPPARTALAGLPVPGSPRWNGPLVKRTALFATGLTGSLALVLGGGVATAADSTTSSSAPTSSSSAGPSGTASSSAGGTASSSPSGTASSSAGGTAAPSAGAAGPSAQDTTYLTQNAQTNLAEITVGQLAAERAGDASIRQTAQQIVADHQQALSQLQTVAGSVGFTLPTEPNAMQQQQAQQLQGLSGTAFDEAYVPAQIEGHQMSVQHTQQEISSGSNQQLIDFATTYLPVAQDHLQMLQADQQRLGSSPTGVNAGLGDAAAPWASGPAVAGLLGVGGLLVAGSAATAVTRRRRA